MGTAQSVLLLLTTVLVLLYTIWKDSLPSYRLEGRAACLLAGAALGVVSAFLGIGGGPLNMALLFFLFSMDAKTAAKNSIFIIMFSQLASLSSALVQGNVPVFSWPQLALMAAGGVGGALLGAGLAKRLDSRGVEKLLLGLMAVIIAINACNVWAYGSAALAG